MYETNTIFVNQPHFNKKKNLNFKKSAIQGKGKKPGDQGAITIIPVKYSRGLN